MSAKQRGHAIPWVVPALSVIESAAAGAKRHNPFARLIDTVIISQQRRSNTLLVSKLSSFSMSDSAGADTPGLSEQLAVVNQSRLVGILNSRRRYKMPSFCWT